MWLNNLCTLHNEITNIHIRNGQITEAGIYLEHINDRQILNFEHAIVFPGLINSHDHLDFNLFPRLGNKRYNSYVEWGKDIHKHDKQVIDKVQKIPRGLS